MAQKTVVNYNFAIYNKRIQVSRILPIFPKNHYVFICNLRSNHFVVLVFFELSKCVQCILFRAYSYTYIVKNE